MKSLLKPLLLAACALAFAGPALAQQTRAYAPENLHTLSYNDQVRVISLEYSEQSGGRRIPDDQLRFYIDQVNRSNWGFSQIKADIATSLGGSGSGPGPWPGNGQTVRCESVDGRGRTCRTPWPGHSRLVRQLSRTACDEGRSWQSQRGQVYVGNGCRAEFAEDRANPMPGPDRVTCESHNSRRNICPTPWMGPSRLERQLSSTRCTEGHNWGSNRGEVWVHYGCRGEFGPGRGAGGGGNGWGGNYSVTCASAGPTPTTCAWDRRYGRPFLLQPLSGARCTENITWGYNDRAGLWVSGGCRARFGTR